MVFVIMLFTLFQGNLLVDGNGRIRITDFGTSLLADATGYNYGSIHGGGALRWTAPELIDPEEFGLETRRPTYSSDVYSFGCVCIEVSHFSPIRVSIPLQSVL